MTTTQIHLINYRQKIFFRLLWLVGLLLVAYLYLVNRSVFDLVSRQRLLSQLSERQSQVAALEADYLQLTNKITPELAHSLGFQDDAGNIIFVAPAVARTVVFNRQ